LFHNLPEEFAGTPITAIKKRLCVLREAVQIRSRGTTCPNEDAEFDWSNVYTFIGVAATTLTKTSSYVALIRVKLEMKELKTLHNVRRILT
jgi:hypothetical protein